MSDESIPRFDPARRRAVTLALALVTALSSFESTVVSTAMPTIIGDLQGLPLYAWVFSLYLLSATVMMPLFGSLADLYGRRRVLLAAMSIFLTGGLACSVARSMPQLIASRVVQGLGAAGLVPVALTVIGDLYSLRERARIQGLFSSIWATAALLGPLLGAYLTVHFGWRSVFWINIPLGALAFTLVVTQMRESRAAVARPFDLRGALLLAVAVTALLFATLHGGVEEGVGLGARLGLLALAAGASILLARSLSTSEHPLIPPALITRRETAAPYLAGILLGTTIFGVDTFVPLYVQGALGGTAKAAGAVVTPIVLLWSVSAGVAARAIVKYGYRRAAGVGAITVLAGFAFLLTAVLQGAGVWAISGACAVIGCGLGPSSMSQVLAIQYAASPRERGVATSLVPFMRAVGGSVGVGALGGILSAGLASRLGPAAAQSGQLLAAGHGAAQAQASLQFREALSASLLPIFGLLAVVAVLNLGATRFFPGEAGESTKHLP